MKKILLIADSNMSLSGVPVVFMSIVRQLHRDYLFDIIVLKNNDMHFEREFLSYGGKVYSFIYPKPTGFFKKIVWFKKYYKEVRQFLKKEIKLEEYAAIHSFNEGFSYPFLNEAKKNGLKNIILHVNSASSAYPQKNTFNQKLFNWYQKKAFKICSKIIFVSKQALELNNYRNKGIVLHNIFNEEIYGTLIPCKHNNLVLTQIGTFSSRKNQLFSLKVLNLLLNEYPNAILNLVGTEVEEGYLDKITKYISENNLKKFVKIYDGNINQIDIYASTSYMLLPSLMESFGLVLIESQSCGIHCFANSSIPNDANMGNIEFIELNEKLWADAIINTFKENVNRRKEPINKDEFSTIHFSNILKSLYKE